MDGLAGHAGTPSIRFVSAVTLRVMPTGKSPKKSSVPVSVQIVERRIYLIRGHKVMIDADLAELYEVPTYRLNEQVQRNRKRFPNDFMFRLTTPEAEALRSQFAISKTSQGGLRSQFATSKLGPESLRSQFATSKTSAKPSRGGRRYLPYAFTEQGVFTIVFDELKKLNEPPTRPRKQIGFKTSS